MKDFVWKKKFLYVVLATLVSCSVAAPAVYAKRGILGGNEGNGGLEKGCGQKAELRGLIADNIPYSSFNERRVCNNEGKEKYCYRKLALSRREFNAIGKAYNKGGRRSMFVRWDKGCCEFIKIRNLRHKNAKAFWYAWKAECQNLGGVGLNVIFPEHKVMGKGMVNVCVF